MEAFQGAKKSIYIETPYFIPGHRLVRVLRLAKRRGVDVQIIVPEKLDVPIVATATQSTFEKILRSGVRIFKYQPTFMHAKTAVVDGEWTTFGSFNMDNKSFIYNHEANVITTNSKCVGEITKHFIDDLRECKEITYNEWKRRGIVARIREFFIGPIRGFL